MPVVVTVDGVYAAYDESGDSVINTTVNGADALLQEDTPVSVGQVIMITQKDSLGILQSLFGWIKIFCC